MLSRRDKLLVQPWEDRRYKDHRAKVAAAGPAVDVRAPAPRAHVALKPKKWQRERERAAAVQRHNHRLLQRLAALMRRHRLDDRRPRAPPRFQNKVGRFYDERTLRDKLAAGARGDGARPDAARAHVRCYACEHNKTRHYKLCAPAAREH